MCKTDAGEDSVWFKSVTRNRTTVPVCYTNPKGKIGRQISVDDPFAYGIKNKLRHRMQIQLMQKM